MPGRRLELILERIPPCRLLCDVGTDHGYIPIAAVSSGKAERAVASDVNPGPLGRAEENIAVRGLSDRIETVLSDGLENLSGDADVYVISGMGGDLMAGIIGKGTDKIKEGCTLVLQPQSRIPEFRHFLHDSGFAIDDETWTVDAGKTYVVITVRRGEQQYDDEVFYAYGFHGITKRDPVLGTFLEGEHEKFQSIITSMEMEGLRDPAGNDELSSKLELADRALARIKDQGAGYGKDQV
ncbi:MAG: SAM-dependent methyltransferase [Lachnospiraceae bacterium]|nr:SAM-dependent methyltransferase [Lachnospiraceae bacterium]